MTNRPSFDWDSAQEYVEGLLPEDVRRLEAENKGGTGIRLQPTIGPSVAQLVDVLILANRPGRVLEIGTSVGYSAIVMGRALRQVGGSLITVEIDPRLAESARANLSEAGLTDVVEALVEDANDTIARFTKPFDLVLQDGNKDDYLQMLPRLVDLLTPHGLLVTDDVLFPIMEVPESAKRWQYAMSLYNQALQHRPDLRTVWLPIGDGVSISVKVPPGDD